MKQILGLGLLFLTNAFAFTYQTPLEMALKVQNNNKQRLHACGMNFYDPFDTRLPAPRIRADYAIAQMDQPFPSRLSAYYREDFKQFLAPHTDEGFRFRYLQPNGGDIAEIRVGSDASVSFQTAYKGVVAKATQFFSGQNPKYRYECGGRLIPYKDQFDLCVYELFTHHLATQICQY